MSTLKAGKLQHPDAANSSIEFDASGNITKFVGPSGGADGNVLTKSGTAPAWTSAGAVGGLVLLQAETLTAVSSISLNNVFSAAYENYKIVFSVTTGASGTSSLRLRASAADETGSNYNQQRFSAVGNTTTAVRDTSVTTWFGQGLVATLNYFDITIFRQNG